jgi:imidazolonepropionase
VSSLLITNIGELVTNAPPDAAAPRSGPPDSATPPDSGAPDSGAPYGGAPYGGAPGPGTFASVADAALVIEAGRVAWTGPAARAPAADESVDAAGRAVLPGFVDSHAHLVFAGERGAEFAARMAGLPYQAGGIRSTVAATRAATDDQLRANLRRLSGELLFQGTTTFECKSGYGLTVPDEARSVALAAEFTPEVTYLGAHVIPPEFDRDLAAYVDLVCGAMLDACAPHARWVDVFCERGAFGRDEAAAVLAAGTAAGLQPRVHANQLGPGPGVQLAVECAAASADHCTYLDDADVDALASSATVATLLPGVEFSTRQPYPDARRLLGAGVTVAIATDCNPGSCFTSSMPLCIALAVREMRMTTQEALWAATAGGARALRRTDVGHLGVGGGGAPHNVGGGHLGVGARADLIMLDAPSHSYLAYRPGVPQIAAVWQAGKLATA